MTAPVCVFCRTPIALVLLCTVCGRVGSAPVAEPDALDGWDEGDEVFAGEEDDEEDSDDDE